MLWDGLARLRFWVLAQFGGWCCGLRSWAGYLGRALFFVWDGMAVAGFFGGIAIAVWGFEIS